LSTTVNPPPPATLSIANASVDESAGSITFTVTLTGDVPGGFSVDFATFDGTAIGLHPDPVEIDYTGGSGTISFSGVDGETQHITIPVSNDDIVELDENFYVERLNVYDGTGNPPQNLTLDQFVGEGNIQNDDAATITVTVLPLGPGETDDEGDPGQTRTRKLKISIDKPVDYPVRFRLWASEFSATEPEDFILPITYKTLIRNTTNWQGGDEVTVTVNGDELVELDETFNLTPDNLDNGGHNVVLSQQNVSFPIKTTIKPC
jgi:hypothetical protein